MDTTSFQKTGLPSSPVEFTTMRTVMKVKRLCSEKEAMIGSICDEWIMVFLKMNMLDSFTM